MVNFFPFLVLVILLLNHALTDVQTIPVNGTWFQLIGNGTTTINNGTNGLQKLDTLVSLAEKHGIFLQLSLTNNWNPLPLLDDTTAGVSARDVTQGTNNSLPRNTLSNDYGQQLNNYLASDLKTILQEEWMSTSERWVIPLPSCTMSSIQIQRFLMPS